MTTLVIGSAIYTVFRSRSHGHCPWDEVDSSMCSTRIGHFCPIHDCSPQLLCAFVLEWFLVPFLSQDSILVLFESVTYPIRGPRFPPTIPTIMRCISLSKMTRHRSSRELPCTVSSNCTIEDRSVLKSFYFFIRASFIPSQHLFCIHHLAKYHSDQFIKGSYDDYGVSSICARRNI